MDNARHIGTVGAFGGLIARALELAATADLVATPIGAAGPSGILGTHYRLGNSKRHASNGKRECSRRLRQIERGQLTTSNGLAA